MNFFFSTTQAGVGASQRQQALEIVSHNIYFVKNREKDIIENLFEPRRRRQQELGNHAFFSSSCSDIRIVLYLSIDLLWSLFFALVLVGRNNNPRMQNLVEGGRNAKCLCGWRSDRWPMAHRPASTGHHDHPGGRDYASINLWIAFMRVWWNSKKLPKYSPCGQLFGASYYYGA